MRIPVIRSVLTLVAFAALFSQFSSSPVEKILYDEPIDALSFGTEADALEMEVRGRGEDGWSTWYALEIENEQDPLLKESNLVLFPEPVSTVEVRGALTAYEPHPIRLGAAPVHYTTAATTRLGRPRVLSRTQWGADDSLLFASNTSTTSSSAEDNSDTGSTGDGGQVSGRVQECNTLQVNYPEDFRVADTVRQDNRGRTYLWPQRYSPEVKLLAVHHTAMTVTGDTRTGVERMRALYQYHSQNRGWGDVGYHFIIDEDGQIYEGRDGGRNVVGGHAYCNNVGTIGVALMGNFELEQPSQPQMKSLQWLLADLADQYDIDLTKPVRYHGKSYPPIVGHRDLISTACPGYYAYEVLGQVLKHAQTGDVDADVRFPVLTRSSTSSTPSRTPSRTTTTTTTRTEFSAVGSTAITGRPGGYVRLSVLYTAEKTMPRRSRLGIVRRSTNAIGLWQDVGNGVETPVRREIIATETVNRNSSSTLRLRVQLPNEAGTYTLEIGDLTYTLSVEGRRSRATTNTAAQELYRSARVAAADSTVQSQANRVSQRVALRLAAREDTTTQTPAQQTRTTTTRTTSSTKNPIRIRLSYYEPTATITSDGRMTVRSSTVSGPVYLNRSGNNCVASADGRIVAQGIVRLVPNSGMSTVSSWDTLTNRFRWTIECRFVDNELALINELPLEEYIWGLAEEPDTEPYEKQRAFAVAARSYAAHYLLPENRKFPGKPYDGNDSPATFQKYGGVVFEERNPRWVQAAKSTDSLVVKRDNTIVKTAYYSANDGRTRSPAEIGWGSYPFGNEVFYSKPDPWCEGETMRGHGVGMSGCGSEGQANEGKSAEDILEYYYPNTTLERL